VNDEKKKAIANDIRRLGEWLIEYSKEDDITTKRCMVSDHEYRCRKGVVNPALDFRVELQINVDVSHQVLREFKDKTKPNKQD